MNSVIGIKFIPPAKQEYLSDDDIKTFIVFLISEYRIINNPQAVGNNQGPPYKIEIQRFYLNDKHCAIIQEMVKTIHIIANLEEKESKLKKSYYCYAINTLMARLSSIEDSQGNTIKSISKYINKHSMYKCYVPSLTINKLGFWLTEFQLKQKGEIKNA